MKSIYSVYMSTYQTKKKEWITEDAHLEEAYRIEFDMILV